MRRAMLFTPSHAELAQHPKMRKLARLLGVGIPTAIGHLHLLWHFALKYAPDGDLARFDCDEIADGCLWDGDGADFQIALVAAGWLDREGEAGVTVHDWDEYGGKYVKRKEANAERMREKRATQEPRTKKPRATHVQRTTDARATLEESREEENRVEERRVEGAKRASRATPAPDEFPISEEMRSWADEHAPGVDIDAETERFLNRNRSKDEKYVNWLAAWKNWMTSPYAKAPARASPNGRHERQGATAAFADLARRLEREEAGEPIDVPEAIDVPFVIGAAHRQPRSRGA